MTHIITSLNELYSQRKSEIEDWFKAAYQSGVTPIYSSVDIRNAGFKLAPVDTNLFPAGFNNVTEAGRARAVTALTRYLSELPDAIKRILIMVENHTRNKPYIDNVAVIRSICEKAGVEVAIGRFDLPEGETFDLETTQGEIITAHSIKLDGTTLVTNHGFVPDMVFVNNDLSGGCPPILCDARQPVFPPPGVGWYRRRKSVHFTAYNQVAREFANAFSLDSWLISTTIHHCGKINFKERKGLECVAIGVDKTIHAIRQKYAEYGIDREPYVFIKADSGTYGMGIMTAHSSDDVMDVNKKTRNKMNVIKEGIANSEVIIQEGVPTIDTVEHHAAEPVVYMMGGDVISTFWRINEGRGDEASLNASGMKFESFNEEAFSHATGIGLIGRLATLAAAYEHYETDYTKDIREI